MYTRGTLFVEALPTAVGLRVAHCACFPPKPRWNVGHRDYQTNVRYHGTRSVPIREARNPGRGLPYRKRLGSGDLGSASSIIHRESEGRRKRATRGHSVGASPAGKSRASRSFSITLGVWCDAWF